MLYFSSLYLKYFGSFPLAMPQYSVGLASSPLFEGLCPSSRVYGIPIVGCTSDPLLLQHLPLLR
ncbi:hypothetical protein ACRRTK_015882 [Alexandromys fortis]